MNAFTSPLLSRPKSMLFLCGLVCGLPFCLPSLAFLSFVGLTGGYLLLERQCQRAKGLYAAGLAFFCGYHLPVYCFFLWMHPLDSTGMSRAASLGVVILAWLGITAVHSAVSAWIFPLFARIEKKRLSLLSPFVFAALWTLWEHLFEWGTFAFPWNRLCYGLFLYTPWIRSASLLGGLWVSFLTVLVCALAAHAYRTKRSFGARLALLFLGLNLIYGLLAPLAASPARETRVVSTVQNDVLSADEREAGYVGKLLNDYTSLTLDCAGSDIILWPEVAVPVNLTASPDFEQHYADLSRELKAPILMGAMRTEGGHQQNAVVAVDENGAYAHYAKRRLVPFGEYLPWRSFFDAVLPALSQLNQLDSDLAPGTDSALLEADGVKVGALVCFDSAFPSLSRDAARDGAQLLVLATNDSWFRNSPATTQHLAQCVLRAVENRRSVGVSAYSGVSAFVSPQGEILSSLPALQKGTLTQTLPLENEWSLYTLVGDLPILAACVGLLGICPILSRKGGRYDL